VDANTIDDGPMVLVPLTRANKEREAGLSPLLDNRDQPEHHQRNYTTSRLHKAPLNRSGPRACPSAVIALTSRCTALDAMSSRRSIFRTQRPS